MRCETYPRVNASVPNEDLAFLHDKVVGLKVLGKPERAGSRGRLLRIEAQHPAVDLVEQVDLVPFAGINRLRSGNLGVLARVDHADGIGARTAVEALHNDVVRRSERR